MSYKNHLLNAMIECPSLERIRGMSALLEDKKIVTDESLYFDASLIQNHASAIVHKGTVAFFEYLKEQGQLGNPPVFKSLLKTILREGKFKNISRLLDLPNIEELKKEAVSENFLLLAVENNVSDCSIFEKLLSFPWEKGQINKALIQWMKQSASSAASGEEVAVLLLTSSEDAFKPASISVADPKGNYFKLVTPVEAIEQYARFLPNYGKGLLNLMVKFHGKDIFTPNDKGQTMAHAWIKNAPEQKNAAYAQTLFAALSKAQIKWWDADPLNLLPSIVDRYMTSNFSKPDFLNVYLAKALKNPVEKGLTLEQGNEFLLSVFSNVRRKIQGHTNRLDFWDKAAPRFDCLFKTQEDWSGLVEKAQKLEAQHPKRLNKDELKALLEKLDLDLTAPKVTQARISPRL